jgi:hypothetical protein
LAGVFSGKHPSFSLGLQEAFLAEQRMAIPRALSNRPNAHSAERARACDGIPIFTWVRLAERIPIRIQIDEVPAAVSLSAGMTATVQIVDRALFPTGPMF